jgi:hypothetical protein
MPLLSAESFARPRKGPLKHADPLIAQYRRALEQAHVEHDRLSKWREAMPKSMDGSDAENEVLARLKDVEVLLGACAVSRPVALLVTPIRSSDEPDADLARLRQ